MVTLLYEKKTQIGQTLKNKHANDEIIVVPSDFVVRKKE